MLFIWYCHIFFLQALYDIYFYPTSETDENEYLLNLGDLEEFHLEVNITNAREPAYQAHLYVIHPPSVRYINLYNKSVSIGNKIRFLIIGHILLFYSE